MGESRDQKSFWTTLPGIITAITGLVVAIGGILGVLVTAGVIGGQPPTSMPPSTPTLAPVATATAAPGLTPHTISPTSTSSTVPPPTATPAPLPTSTSSALSQQPQQWEMTASADLRALGQIVIRVPVPFIPFLSTKRVQSLKIPMAEVVISSI
jgi:hypothetical protein